MTSDEHSRNLPEGEERVGTALNAKWTIVELLGSGGMGAVYAAVHRNGSRVAVKVLHQKFAADADIRERFLREGKIANTVEHGARVPIHDDDVTDRGEPFLVMELLDGESLEQQMRSRGGKLPILEVLATFDVVLDLLVRCHEAGIVHRDIKPANVFMTRKGEVKVLDFGVARMRELGRQQETRAGVALGTPSFMAPEQAMGLEVIDGRADIFSVGACIYSALTGARINQGRSEVESYLLAATQPAPSILRLARDLPVELAVFVDRALAFDRVERFQDAATMRAELRALLAAARAGQMVPAPAKQQAGVVVRGNDLISAEEAPLSKEAKAQGHERMLGIMKHLAYTMAGARQYGWSHTQTAKTLTDLLGALALGTFSVQWEVTSTAFCYFGRPIWQPDRAPLDRVPYQLFADGIRKIELKHGITEQELRDFVAILLRDVSSGITDEDDSVTALWDRRLEHVAYVAIDSFAEGDEDARAAFDQSCGEVARNVKLLSRIDKDWDDGSPEARALELRMTTQLRETGASASALAVDAITRATLGAQMTQGEERWSERYVDAFVLGYVDATRFGGLEHLSQALAEWTRDQVTLKSYALVFRMFELIRGSCATLDADQAALVERDVSRTMFPSATLRTILAEFVTEERRVERARSAAGEGGIGPGLAAALAMLDDDSVFGVACNCFDVFGGEPLGRVLYDYLARWASGNERQLGEILSRTSIAAALGIVRILGALSGQEAAKALEEGFRSQHVEVRLEAVATLLNTSSQAAQRELERLLGDADRLVRLDTLRLIATMGLRSAVPHLFARVRDPAFHRLDIAERRQWIETVAGLDRGRAEVLMIELLEARPLIPSDAIEQTRAYAAEYLASGTTPNALEALKSAAKMRWWNTAPVREAAARAIVAIEARATATPSTSDQGPVR